MSGVLACAAADFAVIAGRGVAEEAFAVGVVAAGGVVRFSGGGYPVATGGGGSGVRRGGGGEKGEGENGSE